MKNQTLKIFSKRFLNGNINLVAIKVREKE